MEIINKVIQLEWEMFQRVNNMGGRANCQDDFVTFEIMRKSQFLSWDHTVVKSYLNDLIDAKRNHRNLLTEKYLIMMKSTDPDYYYQNESMLIPLSNERINQQEEIISIEIEWAE
ncbi:MAG: DUF4125 family protein, partial [Holdemanella sp.]|nr:DUF4125 family protein [Holdemanella sp.]